MTTSPPSSRRQLLARIALIAGAAYAAPVVAELSPAEAQPREWRGSRPSRRSRPSRPSRHARRSRPSRPSRWGRYSRPSRPSRYAHASRYYWDERPRGRYWDDGPRERWVDDGVHLPEWAARLFPR